MLFGGGGRNFIGGTSADGAYLLYGSNSSGVYTMYLTRYPSIEGRWQVSGEGEVGSGQFSPSGSLIYYESEDRLYEVDFQSGPNPSLGTPRQVLELPSSATGDFAVEGDGQSFLIVRTDDSGNDDDSQPSRRGIKVVQNWTQGIPER